MHYLITEDELNRLEGVKHQLGFIYDLCALQEKDNFQQIDMRGLLAFCSAQEEAIQQTIQAAEARLQEAHRLAQTDGTMSLVDWMLALRIASGDHAHTPRGAVEQITRKLTLGTLADPDMTQVQAEWIKILVSQGERNATHGGAASAFVLPAAGPVVRATKAKGATARTAKPKASPRKGEKQAEGAAA